MKHTIATKFLAFLLAACALVAVLACSGSALMLDSYNLYDITPEEKLEQWYSEAGYPVAWRAASEAAAMGPGECSQALAEQLYGFTNTLDKEHYYVTVRQGDEIVHTISEPFSGGFTCEYSITPQYPKVVNIYPVYPPATTEQPQVGTEMPEELPTIPIPTLPEEEPVRIETVDVWEDLQKLIYELHYYDDGPTYTVSVTMAPEALEDTFHSNLTTLYPYRHTLIWAAALALILAVAAVVYLICAAGRTDEGMIAPGGLNRLPLDLYLLAACGVGYWPLIFGIQLYGNSNRLTFWTASLLILCGVIVCLLAVAVLFALAAQLKLGGGYWWRHTALGGCVLAIGRGVSAVMRMLGVIWQWLLIASLMALIVAATYALARNSVLFTVLFCLSLLLGIALICYSGYCFGVIVIGARKMSAGELQHKIPVKYLRGSFRDCAQQMNELSDTTRMAVQNQVRSERMKTELITNVSHDIKTPLTSIINFVDLLGKPHAQEAEQQYLEVLSRQSQQMKKLIEDLIELSKASTGNMNANIIALNATETVNQALGEFADKFEKAKLTPVFHPPEQLIEMAADGRLTWRVLSNLLSNAVKYATPGTRVYVDMMQAEGNVLISIKNISREELKVSAEELMERFVQGDASRKTEGSGLGLNIAKSLMEVQHGSLQLLLDGDLFKVTLIFPAASDRTLP